MSLKCGFVGIVGYPNAGKSSFLNRVISEKIAIVTPKPQTTRRRVLGILPVIDKDVEVGQIVFVDAPGLINSTSGINPFLKEELDDVIKSSDALLAVVSLDEKSPEHVDEILTLAAMSKKPWACFINKTDLEVKAHRLPIIIEKVKTLGGTYFAGTCTHEEGVPIKGLIEFYMNVLPESERPLYDSDLFTPHSTRELCAEIVREKCFEHLQQEIPYTMAVKVMRFDESGKIPKITFEVLVAKDSHKALVIGKKGERLKAIAIASRKEIEKLIGGQVFIEFHVSVKENWMNNKRMMEELGYVVKSEQ
jgi:GTP-binding protein Era